MEDRTNKEHFKMVRIILSDSRQYPKGLYTSPDSFKIYNMTAIPPEEMADVQAFSLSLTRDDVLLEAKLFRVDFANPPADDPSGLTEYTEVVIVESITTE